LVGLPSGLGSFTPSDFTNRSPKFHYIRESFIGQVGVYSPQCRRSRRYSRRWVSLDLVKNSNHQLITLLRFRGSRSFRVVSFCYKNVTVLQRRIRPIEHRLKAEVKSTALPAKELPSPRFQQFKSVAVSPRDLAMELKTARDKTEAERRLLSLVSRPVLRAQSRGHSGRLLAPDSARSEFDSAHLG
jgi:hypothetical protein